MKAIVLAAGAGTRLFPLTSHRPKHLVEIAGRPILKRILDDLKEVDNIDQIIVVVHHFAQQIIDSIQSWYSDDNIVIVRQDQIKGTGDAVDGALQEANVSEPFVVINGDVLFSQSLKDLLTLNDPMVVGAEVEDPTMFGVLDHTDQILNSIKEKPETAPEGALINAGLYLFPIEAIDLFKNLGYSERGEREMTDVLDQLIDMNIPIKVQPTIQPWFDVGNPWQILDATEHFLDKEQGEFTQQGTIESNVTLHGNVHVAATARIRSGVYIEGPVYIDEGADIGPNCYIRGKTYLGRNTRVGNACEIKNSVIYDNTHAAHLSYVGDSVIGRRSNLGAGTLTANLRHDGDNVKVTIKGTRRDTGRRKLGVIMGDGVKTGIGVNILPGVKIASNTWLNAGDTILRDID